MSLEFLFNAAIKGVLEGFTEFLPISSTGHLILVDKLLPLGSGTEEHVEKLNRLFDLVIQLPAILAIVLLFRQRLWNSVRELPVRREARAFWVGLFAAFLPVAIAGLAAKDIMERYLERPLPVAIALIVGGLILIVIERVCARGEIGRAEDVPLASAISIGVFQCLALFPGTSRSGATIVGGRVLGLNRRAAAEFSFFLAIPTMFAACGYKLLKDYKDVNWQQDGLIILVGCIFSFVTAWAVVALFMRLIEKRNALAIWGWYRLVLGAIVLYCLR